MFGCNELGIRIQNSELDKHNSSVWVITELRLGNWSQFHVHTPRASSMPCEILRVRARKLPEICAKRSGMLRLTELASEADLSRPATTRTVRTLAAWLRPPFHGDSPPWPPSSRPLAPGSCPHGCPTPRPVLTLDRGTSGKWGFCTGW
jgi:hypothetical protein